MRMMSGPVNYLEEYRRRYGRLSSGVESEALHTKSANIDDLLSRYLTPIVKSESIPSVAGDGDQLVDKSNGELRVEKCELAAETGDPSKEDDDSSEEDLSEETFPDDLDKTLLPTSTMSKRPSLTVNSILEQDEHLSAITRPKEYRRSKSNPTEERHKARSSIRSRFSNASTGHRFPSETLDDEDLNELLLSEISSSQQSVGRTGSQRRLSQLTRKDSSLSNVSVASSHSRGSQSRTSGILEISDEDLEFEFGEQLGGGLTREESEARLTRLLFESEESYCAESAASTSEDSQQMCSQCRPSSQQRRESWSEVGALCKRCSSLQSERCLTIGEIMSSEENYYRDLCLIQEQFVQPLAKTGLLSASEVDMIFSNLDQLIAVSRKFYDQIQSHLDQLRPGDDLAYKDAMIGRIICESSAMFLAFESYCLNVNMALSTIDNIRKERELFNLFLEESQKENTLLRRMDLKTFLMAPVQRIMKYPLLLQRLRKATDDSHQDREHIESAIQKLTNILMHINAQSRLLTTILSPQSKELSTSKKRTSFEIALTKLCLDTLQWRHDEIHFLVSGKIGYLLPTENRFADKLNNLRFNTAYAALVSKGRESVPTVRGTDFYFPRDGRVSGVSLLIIKKSSSKLQLLREPLHASNCIVARNGEFYDVVHVRERSKEGFVMRPVHNSELWFKYLKYFSMALGGRNQRRRNALSNALLQT